MARRLFVTVASQIPQRNRNTVALVHELLDERANEPIVVLQGTLCVSSIKEEVRECAGSILLTDVLNVGNDRGTKRAESGRETQ